MNVRLFLNPWKFIGDSLNDLSVFNVVRYPIAVSNSHDLVKEKSVYTSDKTNGDCVCEVIDSIISNNMKYWLTY